MNAAESNKKMKCIIYSMALPGHAYSDKTKEFSPELFIEPTVYRSREAAEKALLWIERNCRQNIAALDPAIYELD